MQLLWGSKVHNDACRAPQSHTALFLPLSFHQGDNLLGFVPSSELQGAWRIVVELSLGNLSCWRGRTHQSGPDTFAVRLLQPTENLFGFTG